MTRRGVSLDGSRQVLGIDTVVLAAVLGDAQLPAAYGIQDKDVVAL
ncbi:hypothetical protein WME76_29370 [Sorangium sp. So ce119]